MKSAKLMLRVLSKLRVRPVERSEEGRYREQMARHHYLGDLAKIGETIWHIATWWDQWVTQLNVSAAALKCGVRDRWIGWVARISGHRTLAMLSRYTHLRAHHLEDRLDGAFKGSEYLKSPTTTQEAGTVGISSTLTP